MENSKNGIKKVFGKITVDKVEADRFKDELDSAQLRQEVTKIYPSASVSNSHQDSLFGTEDFGLEGGQEFKSTRVVWIPVPKGTSVEQVEAMLAKCPEAKIYQILSDKAILTDNQEYALENGITDLETIEAAQLVRDSEGEIALHNGMEQYSAKFFSKAGKEDVDLRPAAIEAPAEAATAKNDLAAG